VKYLALVTLLCTLTGPVLSCDWSASAAKTIPTQNATSTGIAAVGARCASKSGRVYDLTLSYVNEMEPFSKRFPMLSVSRVWYGQPKRWLLGGTPEGLVGLTLKGADRCAYNGEVDCNRNLPLPVNFHFGVGVVYKDFRITLYHDSNNHLDHGPEKKNRGLNWASLTYRF
jgi:hypothetical protein